MNCSLINAKPLTYDESTHKLLKVLGAQNFLKQGIQLLILNSKDEDLKLKLNKILKKTDILQFEELLIPIYQKYLTQNDMVELIKFYETTTGKKIIELELLVWNNSNGLDEKQLEIVRQKIFKEHMTVEDNKLVNIFLATKVQQKYLHVEPFMSIEAEKVGREYIIKKIKEQSNAQK
jgi:uncharacterized protein